MQMIACIDSNGGLGYEGGLPWHVPSELAHFKNLTMGRVLGVGGRTKLPPLPGRTVITLSRGKHTLNSFLALEKGGMIIGGASIFEQCIGRVDTIVLSVLKGAFTCDCWLNVALIEQLYTVTKIQHHESFDVFTFTLL